MILQYYLRLQPHKRGVRRLYTSASDAWRMGYRLKNRGYEGVVEIIKLRKAVYVREKGELVKWLKRRIELRLPEQGRLF